MGQKPFLLAPATHILGYIVNSAQKGRKDSIFSLNESQWPCLNSTYELTYYALKCLENNVMNQKPFFRYLQLIIWALKLTLLRKVIQAPFLVKQIAIAMFIFDL